MSNAVVGRTRSGRVGDEDAAFGLILVGTDDTWCFVEWFRTCWRRILNRKNGRRRGLVDTVSHYCLCIVSLLSARK